ncbi:hypothetical protein [Catellatospora vulcania]|uniref:hypothetical protein n=1 Tax=Catellatospora vulcania TaxID=1460450 RepID=UPI0012D39675|nr:hypothetical protein [Catellatospora vulcania]
MSDLNELLADIGDRARIYDVTEQALVRGRRRRTRHRAAFAVTTGAVAVTALLVAVNLPFAGPAPEPAITPSPSPSAVALSACTVAELPTPDGVRPGEFQGAAGDPTGRILASRGRGPVGPVVVIWTDGRPSGVVAVPETVDGVTAVSTTGALVLSGRQAKDGRGEVRYTSLAWVYRNGVLTRLKGTDAHGSGINAAGAIVGLVGKDPVVWQDATAEPVRLPKPAGSTGEGTMAIADDGSVVAPLNQGGHTRLQLWPPGAPPRPLELPATIDGIAVLDSYGGRIADGWISGTIEARTETTVHRYAARWRLDTGKIEWSAGPGDATTTNPQASNPQGWAVYRGTTGLILARGQTSVAVPAPPGFTSTAENFLDWPRVSVISSDGRTLAGNQMTVAQGVPARRVLSWTCR